MHRSTPLPLCVGVTLALLCCLQLGHAQPFRTKRVSDQRLAELETLLVLAKMNREMHLHQPLGYGVADPTKLGRRRRSGAASWEPPEDGVLLTAAGLETPLALRPSPEQEDVLSIGERLHSLGV